MQWIIANWVPILFVAVMLAMYLFGRRGHNKSGHGTVRHGSGFCGGHGRKGAVPIRIEAENPEAKADV